LNRLAVGLVLVVLTGCAGVSSAPGTVQPTLAGIDALGFRCGEGQPDNVPSGLFQWICPGSVEGRDATVLVEGNADGVAGITLVINQSIDADVARRGFHRLVESVPPLNRAPVLIDTLAGWSGRQQSIVLGGVRVSAECHDTQCIVMVVNAQDVLRPLPLP